MPVSRRWTELEDECSALPECEDGEGTLFGIDIALNSGVQWLFNRYGATS